MNTPLSLRTSIGDGGIHSLHAVGEIDLSNVEAFTTALTDLVAGAQGTVTLDFAEVNYLDSAAISALFANADRIQIVANPLLMAAMTVTGLTDLVTVVTPDEAH